MSARTSTPYRMRPWERALFVESIRATRGVPGAFVEVGVRSARGTRCLLSILASEGVSREVVGIDMDPSTEAHHALAIAELGGECEARFLVGLSCDALARLAGPIAWAYVDGCHCRDCVADDVRLIADRLSAGGLIAMHDTCRWTRFSPARCPRTGRVFRSEVAEAIAGSVLRVPPFVSFGTANRRGAPGLEVYKKSA